MGRRTGCLECGAALVYLAAAETMRCSGCGTTRTSAAHCVSGHFYCDACHAGSARDAIERECLETTLLDPVAIALRLMALPGVAMHGPEHHFLVPAALLSAYHNARGEPEGKAASLAEARRRAEPVAGGFCGYQGACGAAIGTGIFVSLATGATPLAAEPWALANRMTAVALSAVAGAGGPRCCKRCSWLAILAAARFAGRHLGVGLRAAGPACEFSGDNGECQEEGCPFFRPPGTPRELQSWADRR